MDHGNDGKASLLERILGEARRAHEGAPAAPVALIEAPDRDLLRALKKASDEERAGLLKLFQKVGARGRRVAEQALAGGGLAPQAAADLLAFLTARDPRHGYVTAWAALGPALAEGDTKAAGVAFSALPESLRALWAQRESIALLLPLHPGLSAWLEDSTDAARSVLEGLGRDTPPALLEGLAALGRATPSRPLQKALRAAFFRLQQMGVAVPELGGMAPSGPPVGEPALLAAAWLSAPDPVGDQAVWIAEELPEGRFAVLQAILGDDGFLGAVRAIVLTRRGHEALRASLAGQPGAALAEIPVPVAMGLLEDAYASNPAAAGRDYAGWRRTQGADRRALRLAPEVVPEASLAALAARSGELYRDGDLEPWLLERGEAERALAMVESESASSLVLSGPEMADRRERALQRASGAVLSPARRERLARRFDGLARYLRLRNDGTRTELAAAAAAALRAGVFAGALARTVEDSLTALASLREREEKEKRPADAAGSSAAQPSPGSESRGA